MITRDLKVGIGREVPVTIGAATAAASSTEPESLVRAAQSALWTAKSRGEAASLWPPAITASGG